MKQTNATEIAKANQTLGVGIIALRFRRSERWVQLQLQQAAKSGDTRVWKHGPREWVVQEEWVIEFERAYRKRS